MKNQGVTRRLSLAIVSLVDSDCAAHLGKAERLLRSIEETSFGEWNLETFLCVRGEKMASLDSTQNAVVFRINVESPIHRPTAKYLVSRAQDWGAFDLVCLLDVDTLVLRDFSSFLSPGSFHVKPADVETVPAALIARVLQKFSSGSPGFEVRTTVSGIVIPMYFNSGVIVTPGRSANQVFEDLHKESLMIHAYLRKEEGVVGTFADQLAISVLAARGQLPPIELLDNRCNFPIHLLRFDIESDVAIVHYHDEKHLTGGLRKFQ